MEFKNNRQNVILDSHGILEKAGDALAKAHLPTFLAKSPDGQEFDRLKDVINGQIKNLQRHLMEIFRTPTTKDPVYATAERLFRFQSPWNLSRDKSIGPKIARATPS
jgi:hypothetical protein